MVDRKPDGEKDWPRPPYAWIITPILIFTLIAIGVILMQLRRRRRRAAQHLATTQGARAAGDNPPRRAAPGTGRARGWVGIRRRDQSVEGLDELGEAPPPYEPAGAKKADVEMGDVGPPGYGVHRADASAVTAPPTAVTRER